MVSPGVADEVDRPNEPAYYIMTIRGRIQI